MPVKVRLRNKYALMQRTLTSCVLVITSGLALHSASPSWFLLLISISLVISTLEGLSLALPKELKNTLSPSSFFLLSLVTLILASLWTDFYVHQDAVVYIWAINSIIIPVTIIWLMFVVVAMTKGYLTDLRKSLMWSTFCFFAAFSTWLALVLFFLCRGPSFILSLLIFVWIIDTVAYFAGCQFGHHKLAPAVSPNKTIEGSISGILAAVLWFTLNNDSNCLGSFPKNLVLCWTWRAALCLTILLGGLSVAGDLFESLLKRRAGKKDSGSILPGHGGVYDRIDAVLPVSSFAWSISGTLF